MAASEANSPSNPSNSDQPGASRREPGRRGKQGETRARLIRVTIELLRGEGLSALTTSRITKAAGIAQPGFYAHFKNVDELVRTAVLEVLEEMRRRSSETRRAAFQRLQHYEDLTNIALMRAAYEDGLNLLLGDPTFAELILRYRRDPSLLGGLMREAIGHAREDIFEDIWRTAQAFGFRSEHHSQVAFWAEQILALYLTAAEALLDGRFEDRDAIIDAITRSSFAIMVANVRAAGLHHLISARPRRAAPGPAPAPPKQ
jgi:TetR/AcrR family transcriptional regulator, fatty acid biosynthesis regulator